MNKIALLYSCFIFLPFILTLIAYRRQSGKCISWISLLGVVLPSLIFLIFSDSGTDYYSYYAIFEFSSSIDNVKDITLREPLFTVIGLLGNIFDVTPHITIVAIKFAIIILFLTSVYILKEDTYIPYSILAFFVINYLYSFYLLSLMLATVIVCIAFSHYYRFNNIINAVFLIVIACGIHYSSLLALVPLIGTWILTFCSDKRISTIRIFIFVVLSALLALFSTKILTFIVTSNATFAHYEKYLEGTSSGKGSGLLQLIYYLPIFYLLIRNKNMYNTYYKQYIFLWILAAFSFFVAELAYIIPIFNRLPLLFVSSFSIIIPVLLLKHRNSGILKFIFFVYFLIHWYMTITQRLSVNDSSELFHYRFFNPFA